MGTAAHDHDELIPRDVAAEVLLAQQPGHRRPLAGRAGRLDAGQRKGRNDLGCRLPRIDLDLGSAGRALRPRRRRADTRGHRTRERAERCGLSVNLGEDELPELRVAEYRAQPAERVGLAAAEGVGRDIRIPEGDHRDAAVGQGAQQAERRLGGLLQVVDDHQAERRDPVVWAAADAHRLDREARELRRVELGASTGCHDLEVLLDEVGRRDPRLASGRPPELAEPRRRHVVLGGPRHEFAELRAESAQATHARIEELGPGGAAAALKMPLKERGDVGVLFGGRHQPRRLSTGGTGSGPHQLEGEGGDGAGERPVAGDPDAQGEAVAKPGGRGARGGEHEKRVRRPAAAALVDGPDPVGDELDDRGCLAGPGGAEHGCRCVVGEVDHAALAGIRNHLLRSRGRRALEPDAAHAPTVAGGADSRGPPSVLLWVNPADLPPRHPVIFGCGHSHRYRQQPS